MRLLKRGALGIANYALAVIAGDLCALWFDKLAMTPFFNMLWPAHILRVAANDTFLS